jgi:hypothetical protein
MSGPYFRKQSWPTFEYEGTLYTFTHLDEYQFTITDSADVVRRIAVTFSDHCFTRAPEPGDNPALRYPHSDRPIGYFCTERYRHSLDLVGRIAQAVQHKVWHLDHEGYAIVPTVDHQGKKTLYGIVFSLDPVTGLPVHLHMRVKSAHPRDERELVTYGDIGFARLVTLRVQRKHPKRIMAKGRKRPRLT